MRDWFNDFIYTISGYPYHSNAAESEARLAKYWAAEMLVKTLLEDAYYNNNDILKLYANTADAKPAKLKKISNYLAQMLKKEWFR